MFEYLQRLLSERGLAPHGLLPALGAGPDLDACGLGRADRPLLFHRPDRHRHFRDAADEVLAAMRRYGLPVWVGSGDRMSLHFPRQDVALLLMNGAAPPPENASEVAAWRSRLPGRAPSAV